VSFWTYMLHCNAGRFYVGHTDDLERRMAQHESAQIRGFTRDYLPVTLVWSDEFPSREEALAAERRIKSWSRAKKLALIRGEWGDVSRLAQGRAGLRQAQPERSSANVPSPASSILYQ
jgi:putative endonuclease